jgi:hypothetical protein
LTNEIITEQAKKQGKGRKKNDVSVRQ